MSTGFLFCVLRAFLSVRRVLYLRASKNASQAKLFVNVRKGARGNLTWILQAALVVFVRYIFNKICDSAVKFTAKSVKNF